MTKYKLEYIWLDGYTPTPNLRGKTQIKEFDKFPTLEQLPLWGFDGSSTNQAPGDNSDCVLRPVRVFPDPIRGGDNLLVLCEVLNLPPEALFADQDHEAEPSLGRMEHRDTGSGTNQERAFVVWSTNGGDSYSPKVVASQGDDRANFPAVAISPDGRDVYLVYNAHLDPWRTTTADPRRMLGVVRHADVTLATGAVGAFTTLHRGAVGDGRGSSANGLTSEFLGDYNYAVATREYAAAVWVDSRAAAVCPAINAYRQSLVDGSPIPPPAPNQDCPDVGGFFGNTDIFGGSYADPTTP